MTTTPDAHTRILVDCLVERSGLPASTEEVDGLVAAAPSVVAAVRRLYSAPMDHETEPAVELTVP